MSKVKVFCAYKGKQKEIHDDNVESFRSAARTINEHTSQYEVKLWEDYTKTDVISREIIDAVRQCDIFVCDLTYYNHNVIFELGLAIACERKILILINEKIAGSKARYEDFILKDIRYSPFENSNGIAQAINRRNYQDGVMKRYVNSKETTAGEVDVFHIVSKENTQASLDLTETVSFVQEEKSISVVSDDINEIHYQSMQWYFLNLLRSRIILIHFLGTKMEEAETINCNNSFYAGIAVGLKKEVLLLAPAKFNAPLDYHEILEQYRSADELTSRVFDWLMERVEPEDTRKEVAEEEQELNLIRLGVGYEVAENERKELLHYFVETAAYLKTKRANKSILVGRKGSGKTAIYLKLLDDYRKDPMTLVVPIKPESEELLEDVEMSKLYEAASSKKTFFVSVWRFVIFTKLMQSIYEKINNDSSKTELSEEEKEVVDYHQRSSEYMGVNFYGFLRILSKGQRIEPQILEKLYSEYLGPLITVIRRYIASVKASYFRIVIIADNLDRTWRSDHDLDVQSEMILSLIDIDHKIDKDLFGDKAEKSEIRQVLLLRKDIFDYIEKRLLEEDKLMTMTHEVDWAEHPHLLRQMVEQRFDYILKGAESPEDVWKKFFALKGNQHPYDKIQGYAIKRPRDIIYLISKMFDSAINNGRKMVIDEDIVSSVRNYSTFLYKNLVAELKAEHPSIDDIFSELREYGNKPIDYRHFRSLLENYGYNEEKTGELVDLLFKENYLIGETSRGDTINTSDELRNRLEEKWLFFFRRKIFLRMQSRI